MPSSVASRDALDDGSLNGVLINKIHIHGIKQYLLKCLQVDASSSLSFLFTNDEKLIFEYDRSACLFHFSPFNFLINSLLTVLRISYVFAKGSVSSNRV